MKKKQGLAWNDKFHKNKLKERKTKDMKRDGIILFVNQPKYESVFIPSKKKKQ